MSELCTFFVDKQLDRALDVLAARYDLSSKARVFGFALALLAHAEREDEGCVLGYLDNQASTFYRAAIHEAAETLRAKQPASSKKKEKRLLYTLILDEDDIKLVERLQVRFKLQKPFQVFHLAVLLLRLSAIKEDDEEMVVGLYNTKEQSFARLKREGYAPFEQEAKLLLERMKNRPAQQ